MEERRKERSLQTETAFSEHRSFTSKVRDMLEHYVPAVVLGTALGGVIFLFGGIAISHYTLFEMSNRLNEVIYAGAGATAGIIGGIALARTA